MSRFWHTMNLLMFIKELTALFQTLSPLFIYEYIWFQKDRDVKRIARLCI